MLPLIGLIGGAITKLGGAWMESRKVKAEGKMKIKTAKVEAKIAHINARAQMDLSAQNGMQYSWKDEYLMIVLTLPVIAAFIPGAETYIEAGFRVLSETPEWYRWALTGLIAATFGLRTWAGFKK